MSYGVIGRGDYGAYQGDPGIFGFLKKVGGGLAGKFLKGTPMGMALGTVAGLVGGRKVRQGRPAPPSFPGLQQFKPKPGIKAKFERLIPGGATGMVAVKRRRMNVANPKALRKAIRRQAGFVKLARKALKGSGYTITSRGASRGRRTGVHISESGPGSVRVSR